jgi:hypothetical protein
MTSLISKKLILKHDAKIRLQYKRKGSEKYENENASYTKRCEKNEAKQSEMKRNFCLFVSQTEAKIMRNGLRFASISHEAKKKLKRKRDTLVPVRVGAPVTENLRNNKSLLRLWRGIFVC